jgi:hypothetical protein
MCVPPIFCYFYFLILRQVGAKMAFTSSPQVVDLAKD